MGKTLNNDQMIKKANKDVRELGMMASTTLIIEINELIKRRIVELDNGAENINPFVHYTNVQKVLQTYLSAFTQ